VFRDTAEVDALDGAVDDNLKKLVKELGEAINQAVADSDRISEVMDRIKTSGNDVFLVLEASIGFSRHADSSTGEPGNRLNSENDLEITSQDVQFLRALRITVNDDK
jgi:hypothetical protein